MHIALLPAQNLEGYITATVLIVLAAALGFAANARWNILRSDDRYVKQTTPPLNEKFATKEALTKLEQNLQHLSTRMDEEFTQMRESAAKSRQHIYESIRKVEKLTAELKTSEATQKALMHEMAHDIKTLISHTAQLQGKMSG